MIDFSKIKVTDIARIELDTTEDSIEVEYNVSVDGEIVSNTDTFELPQGGSPEFEAAARELVRQAVEAVRTRSFKNGPLPCETCTGGCCHEGVVRITSYDLEALTKRFGQHWIDKYITMLPSESFAGYVGTLARCDVAANGVEVDEGTEGCVFLRKDGCSIYEDRPEVCREYSCWDCEDYNEDPKKRAKVLAGKKTLRVIQ